ncbi:OB-fold nucleic acid binding domain-containing protein [Methanothermococcus okinawensis]|uniref:Nucleic acid binding OB-fold tRNA/helicase-type n=1 Tax=Methanothermococcus okinawensis (strain DSM 14208 / JCM 11175 / IH1) TaxID=647113 RepID=F8AL65_METOI|nr:OB-fold nucleic acid binding domain-containing protein [Methanothermococcus okinawensis]AEH06492.1 nucleic acid binding OB-fold tRNA/helicase-type [Methanothermococcus okinawensis IH1]
MKLTEKRIGIICIGAVLIGIIFLHFYELTPKTEKIADIKEGDYVKIVGVIQDMKVVRDDCRYIQKIKYIKIRDDSGGDLRIYAFKDVNNDLTNYIKSTNPTIKEGDIVEVIGTIKVYNGIYEIILDDASNFKLIEKKNFERDIYLSPNPTNIYASKYGKTYHTSKNCPYGKKIKDKNKIYFYSEEDAKALGYKKCKWCNDASNN